jgi:Tol biopolymer transport system component
VARDGRIVFVETVADPGFIVGALRVRERDGTVHPLAPAATLDSAICPTWSPDMRYIAYRNGFESSVRVVRTDGSGLLVAQVNEWATCPSWSPDGTRLSYGIRSGHEVWLAVADATSFPALSATVSESPRRANFGRWSPAGDVLASFVEEGGWMWIERTPLPVSVMDCCSIVGTTYLPDWSPDGTLIVSSPGGGLMLTDATGDGTFPAEASIPIFTDDPAFVPAGVSFTR